jgi:hypothetical protein
VIITGVRVEGTALPLSPAGETEISLPNLPPGRDQIQLDFVALSFGAGDVPQYQYMLETADEDWSVPTQERSVIYAGLRQGSYRFLVRAVNSDGLVSSQPASAVFRVLAPIWLRWWFLLGFAAPIALTMYSAWLCTTTSDRAFPRLRF